jgi:ATP-binding cassette subfamily B protein
MLLPNQPFPFVLHFLRYFKWPLLLMALLETGQAASGILTPYVIGDIIKIVTTASGWSDTLMTQLQRPLLWFLGLNLAELVFSRASGVCLLMVAPRLRQKVTADTYTYLQGHSQRFFSEHFAGSLSHQISQIANSLTNTLWIWLFDFLPITVVFSVSIFLLSRVHTGLAQFVSLWVLFFVLISYRLARRCHPYAQKYADARSRVNGKIVDSVSNLTSVRLFARFREEQNLLNEAIEQDVQATRRAGWYTEAVRWFLFIAAMILKFGTLYYALQLWQQGLIGVGDFAMSTSLALLIINDARNLSRHFLEIFEHSGNIANGVQTIIRPYEIVDSEAAKPIIVKQGEIAFQQVDFSYSANKKIFNQLNISIPAGQRVGLVGYSGSGKSSFVNLILRFYDVQAGCIRIDGQDIRQITQDSLHQAIGFIPQDPSLFHRTLLENIRYGRLEATDEEVIVAAKQAHAHEFISTMPEGYAAMVGERGVKLSGGQRQRIAIARVMLKNAPILILDEATASLDSATEFYIQQSLEQAMMNKTVLVIAHRLSTIAHLDRILVFEQGRIVEDGSHAELLAAGGHYKKLWDKQAGGFLPETAV